ncbi:MAG: hypothetical protein DRP79_03785 [Planctomycetota bacterium]|nr:MAG: hypothetical protein DRP79_03785 [Planctomycetota bacterium]
MRAVICAAVAVLLTAWVATPVYSPAKTEESAEAKRLPSLQDYEKQLTAICASACRSIVQIEAHYPTRCFDERGREVRPDSPEKKFTIRPPCRVASGFLVTDKGHIVTLTGGVEAAERIVVRPSTGEAEYEAQIVGTDRETGIAVIKIDGGDFKPVRFGKSSELRRGCVVASVGNPFGLRATASFGTVSGLNRAIRTGTMLYTGLIQCTAPAYPGDSGGLIVNSSGEAVGIVISTYRSAAEGLRAQLKGALSVLENYQALTDPKRGGGMSDEEFIKEFRRRLATMTERQKEIVKSLRMLEADPLSYRMVGNTETLNFAIPIDAVTGVIDQLIKTGKVVRPLFGLKIREIDDEYRGLFGLQKGEGMLVEGVISGGPADKAGIRKKDIIVAIDGRKVSTLPGVKEILAEHKPGDKVSMTLIRGEGRGEKIEVEITLGTR